MRLAAELLAPVRQLSPHKAAVIIMRSRNEVRTRGQAFNSQLHAQACLHVIVCQHFNIRDGNEDGAMNWYATHTDSHQTSSSRQQIGLALNGASS